MSYSADVLALSPVSYWRMNDASGTTATDETGAHPGTFTSGLTMGEPGGVPNDTNKSFKFTGATAQTISSTGWALSSAAYTVIALVRLNSTPPTTFHEGLLGLNMDGTQQAQIYARRNATNNRFSYWDNTNTHIESTATLPLDTWTHVAVRVNGTSISFFVNGVPSGTSTMTAPADTYATIYVGGASAASNPLKGWEDEVAVYNKALTDAQIASLSASWTNNGQQTTPAVNLEKVRSWTESEAVSDNSIQITPPADLKVGEVLVVSIGRTTGSGAGTITGVAGVGTNAWVQPASSIRAATMIADTLVVPITQLIAAGTPIIASLSGGSPNRKAIVSSVWRGLTGAVDSNSGMTGPNGTSPTAVAAATSAVTHDSVLTIGTFAIGNVAWSADGGSVLVGQVSTQVGTTDRGVVQQYRIDSGQNVKSSEGTLASGSWAGTVITLPIAAATPGAPTANAGSRQTLIEPWSKVQLSAANSVANTGTISSYHWEQTDGPTVALSNPNIVNPTFEAPPTVLGTICTFRVTVTNSGGLSNTATVNIEVMAVTNRVVKKINGVLTEVPVKILNHKP